MNGPAAIMRAAGDAYGKGKAGSSLVNCRRILDRGKTVNGHRVRDSLQDEVRAGAVSVRLAWRWLIG
jgi:hypothetical protein